MKNYIVLLVVFLMLPFAIAAQETEKESEGEVEKVKEKLERSAFESSYIVDNPTNVVLQKNELEVQMYHRFGLINDDKNDMAGFWGASNIKIGAAYGIHERLTLGVGITKFDNLVDFNWKAALLRQTRSNKMPVSVTYFGNWAVDAGPKEDFQYVEDRWSFFNQIIIARRFSPNFSMVATGSVSHYNIVENTMKNDMIAFSLGGRYKISPNTAILVDYSHPITEFMDNNPPPGVSIGVEFGTSAHAFQLFLTNYNGLVPQKNYMFNQNDFFNGEFMIGFNITRLYNF